MVYLQHASAQNFQSENSACAQKFTFRKSGVGYLCSSVVVVQCSVVQCSSIVVQQCNSEVVQQCRSVLLQQCSSSVVQQWCRLLQCSSVVMKCSKAVKCKSVVVQQCSSISVVQQGSNIMWKGSTVQACKKGDKQSNVNFQVLVKFLALNIFCLLKIWFFSKKNLTENVLVKLKTFVINEVRWVKRSVTLGNMRCQRGNSAFEIVYCQRLWYHLCCFW